MMIGTGRLWRGMGLSLCMLIAAGCDAGPEPDANAGAILQEGVQEGVQEAAQAAAHDGERAGPDDPQYAGAACLTSKECAVEEYCATPPGECGREGVCTLVPVPRCDRTRDTVCSCDGATYDNACLASKDKQSVDHAGACPPPPCTSNAECASGSYCAKAAGDCPGVGVCEVKPVLCSGAWNPVCGCNNLTYANACKASAVGVTVKKLGAC